MGDTAKGADLFCKEVAVGSIPTLSTYNSILKTLEGGMRYLAVVLVLLFIAPAFGAYPYDAVGVISAGGSGTLIFARDGKGLVLTAAHVVATIGETKVSWNGQTRVAKTVFVDIEHDFALLVCNNPPVSAVSYAKVQGRIIIAAGYPWHSRKQLCWQPGVVRFVRGHNLIVTAKPEPGMSGGGCFDYTGNLVGVVQWHNETSGGLGIKPLIEMLNKYSDTKLWVPDDGHRVKPTDYVFAKPEKPYRSIPYSIHTAPRLPSIHSVLK